MDSTPQGFQFPGWFEVKALGVAEANLAEIVPRIVAELGLSIEPNSLSSRASSGGRYVAISLTFQCPSREELVAVHAALRAHPDIRWTL